MKKLIYFIIAILTIGNVSAQFSFNNKSVSVSGWGSDTEPKDAQCIITNNSSTAADSMINWSIVTFDVPSGWQFDFCDPYDCIVNLSLGFSNTFKLKASMSGPLKGQFYTNGNAGNATVKIRLAYTNGSHDADTITLMAKGWATGLSKVKKQSEVTFFPNPAKDLITLRYPTTKAIDVTVYNVLGAKVKAFTHSSNETSLNISDLEKGLYFIRFNDNGNIVSKSFTKSE
ncbi:MAG: T9SS type A sorting domain-containing protein [Bacteroidia bacterium]